MQMHDEIELEAARAVTDELVAAMTQLVPQLSSSALVPTRQDLDEIVGSPCTVLLVARDRSAQGRIVACLTLAVFSHSNGRASLDRRRHRGFGAARTRGRRGVESRGGADRGRAWCQDDRTDVEAIQGLRESPVPSPRVSPAGHERVSVRTVTGGGRLAG